MSISVIGASSKQMGQMRNKTELQSSNSQKQCKLCMMKDPESNISIVGEPLIEKKNEMSIGFLHKKVELELKEKQKKILLLRQGITITTESPRRPPCLMCKHLEIEEEESRCSSLISWGRSHPVIVLCILCALVISIVIIIIVIVLMVMK